jgi:hypothetical protein
MTILSRRMPFRFKATAAAAFVVCTLLTVSPSGAAAQEVNGIYTEPATKDLGTITNIDLFRGIKFRGWVEAYYVWNGNRVDRNVANRNQDKSVVKSRDLTIEGRTFDIHHNSFTANLAEVEIEKVPDRGGIGFKVDLAFSDTQDIIVDTIQSAHGIHAASAFDKNFQHASISYVAPVGSGLRFDVGKFVTHNGGETITSIKNRNFSHAFFYTYAIPFQDSGLRVNYAFSPKVYGELYLLNGWNVTSDNNTGKTIGTSLGLTPSPKLSVYANYLGGPEHTDSNDDWRHLGDFQVIFLPVSTLQLMVNLDVGTDKNALGPGADASWGGVTFYVRPTVRERFFPTLRLEYFDDPDGFATGVAQTLWGVTFTGDVRVGPQDGFAKVLVRPELRYDKSDADFFSRERRFRSRDYQATVGVGLVAYF